jgi:hypothetical protein
MNDSQIKSAKNVLSIGVPRATWPAIPVHPFELSAAGSQPSHILSELRMRGSPRQLEEFYFLHDGIPVTIWQVTDELRERMRSRSGTKSRQLLQLAEELHPYRVARGKGDQRLIAGED